MICACVYQSWYFLSKTEAESQAWEYAKTSGLDVVVVCPGYVFRPLPRSTVNASSLILIQLLKGAIRNYLDCKNLPPRKLMTSLFCLICHFRRE